MADPALPEFEAHPAANAYRMMSEDELADLAADIAANGLLDPITIGVLNGERFLVDGRNRLKACRIANVQPEYEEIEFVDAESVGAFVASLLRQARAVLTYSPPLAREVRDGVTPLKEAFETVMAARERREIAETQWRRLAQEAPDLAARVTEESLSLAEAITLLDERQLPREEVIRGRGARAFWGIAEIGRHLTEAKEAAGDRWLPWLATFGWSHEVALPFMRVAEQLAKREPLDPDLTIDFGALYRLAEVEPGAL
jgi:hypothetical protein